MAKRTVEGSREKVGIRVGCDRSSVSANFLRFRISPNDMICSSHLIGMHLFSHAEERIRK